MIMNIRILLFLIISDLVTAETISSEVTGQVFIIIGIIIGSIFVIISLIILLYFISRFLKRKMLEPQYYIDETPNIKNNSEYDYIDSNSLQPNMSMTHIVVSIKQCFIDLRDSLIPFGWSQAQQHIHHPKSPINEKKI